MEEEQPTPALESLEGVLTVVIPSYQRGETLERAIASACRQDPPISVIVVDDGSDPPLVVPKGFPSVQLIRLPANAGGSAARNAGVRAAATPWVTFLDDDDELLLGMSAELGRQIAACVKDPCCFVSAIEVVDDRGRMIETRIPETRERGELYFLEPYSPGRSYLSKQTFVIPRRLYLAIGGFDEALRSRIHSELALRLNASSRIVALDRVTYRLHRHSGPRVSSTKGLRQRSFDYIWAKHRAAIEARPEGAARWARAHADRLLLNGHYRGALQAVWRSGRLDLVGTVLFGARKLKSLLRFGVRPGSR